jgi:hypothetical protein
MLLAQWRDAAEPADAVIRPLQLQRTQVSAVCSATFGSPPTNGNAKGDLPESEAITTFKLHSTRVYASLAGVVK